MLTETFTPNLLEVSHLMSFSHIWHVLSPDSTSVRPSHFPTVLVKPLTASFFKSYASGVLFSPKVDSAALVGESSSFIRIHVGGERVGILN